MHVETFGPCISPNKLEPGRVALCAENREGTIIILGIVRRDGEAGIAILRHQSNYPQFMSIGVNDLRGTAVDITDSARIVPTALGLQQFLRAQTLSSFDMPGRLVIGKNGSYLGLRNGSTEMGVPYDLRTGMQAGEDAIRDALATPSWRLEVRASDAMEWTTVMEIEDDNQLDKKRP